MQFDAALYFTYLLLKLLKSFCPFFESEWINPLALEKGI